MSRPRCGQRSARLHFDLFGNLREKQESAFVYVVVSPAGAVVTGATSARLARLVDAEPGGWYELPVGRDEDLRALQARIRAEGVDALERERLPLVAGARARRAARLVTNRRLLPGKHWLVQHCGAHVVRGEQGEEPTVSDAALHLVALLGASHPQLRRVLGRTLSQHPEVLTHELLSIETAQLGSYLSWRAAGGSSASWHQLPAGVQTFPAAVTSLSALLAAGISPARIEDLGAVGTQVLAHLGDAGLGMAHGQVGSAEEELRQWSSLALARRLSQIGGSADEALATEAALLRQILDERLALLEATPPSQRVRLLVDAQLVGVAASEWREALSRQPSEVKSCVISAAWGGRCTPPTVLRLVERVGVSAVLGAKPAALGPLLEATAGLGEDAAEMAWRAYQLLGTYAPRYLERMDSLGASVHDALYWLPVPQEAAARRELAEFLLRQLGDRRELPVQLADARVAARGWEELDQQQRKGSLRSVAGRARAADSWGALAGSAVARAAGEHKVVLPRSLQPLAVMIQATGESLPSTFPTRSRYREGSLTGSFLERGDGRGLLLGELTDCCQHLGDAGKDCATHGQMSLAGGFFVVEDARGIIVAQSWVWRNGAGEVCFDNIEMLNGALSAEANASRTEAVVGIYDQAAQELLQSASRVSVGQAYVNDPDLARHLHERHATAANQRILEGPADYAGGYRDSSHRQWVIAERSGPGLTLSVENSRITCHTAAGITLSLRPQIGEDDVVSLVLECADTQALNPREVELVAEVSAGLPLEAPPELAAALESSAARRAAPVQRTPLDEQLAVAWRSQAGTAPPGTAGGLQLLPPTDTLRQWRDQQLDLALATTVYRDLITGVADAEGDVDGAITRACRDLSTESANAVLQLASTHPGSLEDARGIVLNCEEQYLDAGRAVTATQHILRRSERERRGGRHTHAPGICPTLLDDADVTAASRSWGGEHHEDYYYDDYDDPNYDSASGQWRRSRRHLLRIPPELHTQVQQLAASEVGIEELEVLAASGACIDCVPQRARDVRETRSALGDASPAWREQVLAAVATGVITPETAQGLEDDAGEAALLSLAVRYRVHLEQAETIQRHGFSPTHLQEALGELDLALTAVGSASIALSELNPGTAELSFIEHQRELRRRNPLPAGAQVLRSWREEWVDELLDEAEEEREREAVHDRAHLLW